MMPHLLKFTSQVELSRDLGAHLRFVPSKTKYQPSFLSQKLEFGGFTFSPIVNQVIKQNTINIRKRE